MLQRAYYAGLVKQIDHEVGCMVEALNQKGIRDNTVIIFASDHGDYLGDHGLSGKASYYEAACHVPMLVSHSGVPRNCCLRRTCHAYRHHRNHIESSRVQDSCLHGCPPAARLRFRGRRAQGRYYGAVAQRLDVVRWHMEAV